jgi:hypothetical protein
VEWGNILKQSDNLDSEIKIYISYFSCAMCIIYVGLQISLALILLTLRQNQTKYLLNDSNK